MNNLVTINPNNVKYISEYFTNLIFQLLYKDKIFSQILSLPEFSQPFEQAIDQYFQKQLFCPPLCDVYFLNQIQNNAKQSKIYLLEK